MLAAGVGPKKKTQKPKIAKSTKVQIPHPAPNFTPELMVFL